MIKLAYNGMAVPGSPFSSKAYDTSAIVVSPISSGVTGKATEFTSKFCPIIIIYEIS